MAELKEMEEKLRRSSLGRLQGEFVEFMGYARQVRDELEVYLYMQENGIGIDRVEYWLARLELLRRKCYYADIVKLLEQVKRIPHIRLQPEFMKICTFESDLEKEVNLFMKGKFRGKRRADQFNLYSLHQIGQERRNINGRLIYIDPQCRGAYRLEDYSNYIQQHFKDECEIEAGHYERAQALKPLSFVGQKNQSFEEFTKHLKQRKTEQERKNTRFSNAENMPCRYSTPKRTILDEDNEEDCRNRTKKQGDSVEILKELRKSLTNQKRRRSPSFGGKQILIKEFEDEGPQQLQIEHCRADEAREVFSFGRTVDLSECETASLTYNECNVAIILEPEEQKSRNDLPSSEDFQLELIIKQIQRQNQEIETQTFSEQIDSNQENHYYLHEINRFTQPNSIYRVPFYALPIDPNPMNLEELIDLNDRMDTQFGNQFETQFGNQFETQFDTHLSQTEDLFGSQQDRLELPQSERKVRSTRMARITEENSYSHSEVKLSKLKRIS